MSNEPSPKPVEQPESTPATADATQPEPTKKSGVRWKFPVIVLVLAVIAQGAVIGLADDDISILSLGGFITWMLAFLLTLLWWVFFSGLRWKTRLAGIGLLVAGVAVFLTLFRPNGQTGNFIPQFTYRFAPSAEERALEYFEQQQPSTETAAANGDESAANVDSDAAELEVTDVDWPKFGGPRGDHIVQGATIRRDWDANPPRLLWRHPVGPAWSSFAVVDDYAYTQEQRGNNEAVVCYDANTGEQVWVHEDEERFYESASGAGPRSTPTVHDGRLYALGATGVLNCLNPVTGEVYWTTNIVKDADTDLIEWGMAGSPCVYDDIVIVNPGGPNGAVAAYDRISGEKRWAGGEHRAGYATPQVAVIDEQPQVVIFCAEGVCGHDITSGEMLWHFTWTNLTKINAAQPFVLPDDKVFVSTGYGAGSVMLDVSRTGDEWNVAPEWERPNKFKLKFNGGIYRDGYVYGLDEGILSCFDLKTGKRTWKKGRYKFGQVVMVGDDLLVQAESGEVALVEVSPESMSEVAKFQAIEGKTWNHPVYNRGRLFVRNAEEAACYDFRPKTQTAALD